MVKGLHPHPRSGIGLGALAIQIMAGRPSRLEITQAMSLTMVSNLGDGKRWRVELCDAGPGTKVSHT